MKDKTVKMFDHVDYEFIDCLRVIGIERKQAAILAFFRVEEIGTSRDIEAATSLRQPEVSLATSALTKLGFIKSEQIMVLGKRGQHNNRYSLATPLEDIIKYFWGESLKSWEKKMDTYKKLSDYEIRPFSG